MPGREGAKAAALLAEAMRHGREALASALAPALRRALAAGPDLPAHLFSDAEMHRLTEALAGANAAADLLGRARVREMADGKRSFAEFRAFADAPIPPLSPEAALSYFRALVPTLGVDPQRYGRDMRRAAFTLAEDSEGTLTGKVQAAIADYLEHGTGRVLAGTTADGREVVYTRHARADATYSAVLVDPAALDAAWSLDESYYIPPGGGGAEVKGRREDFARFLGTGKSVEAPLADYDPETGAISFTDGRHRFSYLRDAGVSQVAVMVPADQAARVRERFGSDLPEVKSALTGPQQIQELLDAAGVTPANPQYAEMVFRTNAADAYNTGSWDEFRSPDLADDFPAWQYTAVTDARSRPHHAARDGQIYPAGTPFNEVRGTDISDAANCRCSFIPLHKSELPPRP